MAEGIQKVGHAATVSAQEIPDSAQAIPDVDRMEAEIEIMLIYVMKGRRHYYEKLSTILGKERTAAITETIKSHKGKGVLVFNAAQLLAQGLNIVVIAVPHKIIPKLENAPEIVQQLLGTREITGNTNATLRRLTMANLTQEKCKPFIESTGKIVGLIATGADLGKKVFENHKKANVFELEAKSRDAGTDKERSVQEEQKDEMPTFREFDQKKETRNQLRMRIASGG